MLDRDSAPTATEIAQNSAFEKVARTGFFVSGLMHLAIGYLAIRIAMGSGIANADQSGAFSTVAAEPGGTGTLWVATVAFATMAMWRLVETAVGRSTDPKSQHAASEALDRGKAFALAVVYFALAHSTFGFASGAGRSTGEQNSGISARLMQTDAGTFALVAGGVVIVAVGGYHIFKGASQNFVDDLKGSPSNPVRRLGTLGYIAKGLAIAGVGILVIVAATRSEPNKASGLDAALKTLGAQPYGVALLIAAGMGISTYGLYSFVMARNAKM
ncbi:membrane protein [Mycolicibacterium cyprinidarum]|nr:membrane protein [Mycolicibacterium sp. NGTWS1803]